MRMRWGIALVSVLAIGCGGSDTSELSAYIEAVKQRPPAPVKPLPEIQPIDTYVFDPAGRRDPFIMDSVIAEAAAPQEESSIAPDPLRPKEQLESYPLTDLAMVGTLYQQDTLWALIRNKQGLLFRVRVGNYMGTNNGQIVEITEKAIHLTEVLADSPGKWRENSAVIPLKTTGGDMPR